MISTTTQPSVVSTSTQWNSREQRPSSAPPSVAALVAISALQAVPPLPPLPTSKLPPPVLTETQPRPTHIPPPPPKPQSKFTEVPLSRTIISSSTESLKSMFTHTNGSPSELPISLITLSPAVSPQSTETTANAVVKIPKPATLSSDDTRPSVILSRDPMDSRKNIVVSVKHEIAVFPLLNQLLIVASSRLANSKWIFHFSKMENRKKIETEHAISFNLREDKGVVTKLVQSLNDSMKFLKNVKQISLLVSNTSGETPLPLVSYSAFAQVVVGFLRQIPSSQEIMEVNVLTPRSKHVQQKIVESLLKEVSKQPKSIAKK